MNLRKSFGRSLACIVLSLSLFTVSTVTQSCARVSATTPSSTASVEKQVYADLLTIQTALEGIKSQAAQFPAIAASVKPQLNQAIVAYNTAQLAFVTYEKAKTTNVANPADLTSLLSQIAGLQTQITALGRAFSQTPAAVATVQE